MQVLEFLTLHPVTLKTQVYMISWKLTRRWPHNSERAIESFLDQKGYRWRAQRSTGMVEITQGIVSLCWVCSLTNFGDCRFSNRGGEGLWHYKYMHKTLKVSIGHWEYWNANKHLEELARWCSCWGLGIHGTIHWDGWGPNEKRQGFNWKSWHLGNGMRLI